MATFKTNHNHQRSSSSGGGILVKVGLFGGFLTALFFAFKTILNSPEHLPAEDDPLAIERAYMLPTSTTGQVIHHNHYSLSYHEAHEQAEWVAYELTRESLKLPNVPRTNNFREDPKVSTGTSTPYDFGHPEYDRGHLAPAGDMAFSEEAMSQSFFMSNISPQHAACNQGVWRELEENTRYWAGKFKRLFVVSGPVLAQPIKERIGNSQVSVPQAYFKVLLDIDEPEKKGIGFIVPNRRCEERLTDFMASIDDVETLTGINFFPELLSPELEASLEATYDPDLWSLSEKKYQLRKEKWNDALSRRRSRN